jgi:hypothetical protein
MPRKSVRKTSENVSSGSDSGSNFSIDYRTLASDLYNNPTVRYMAGGVAAAILTRFANRLNDKYPEISNFLRENIDTLEGKLSDYKSGLSNDRNAEARH